jgi:teichuronic acid biosynthesis glycosyltransferase TuaC
MINAALQNDWTVTVLAPVPYYPPLPWGWRRKYRRVQSKEQFQGMTVYHPRFFMIPKIGMAWQALLLFLSVYRLIRRLKRTVNFDCIDAHYVYPDGVVGVLLGQAFNVPVVITVRGSDVNVFQHFPLIRWWLCYALKKAHAVIVVSQALREAVMKLGVRSEQIHVIANGVDGKKFYPISKNEAKNILGLPEHQKVLLSVANLTENKGMELLLRAFSLLRNETEFSVTRLLIVGEGPEKTRLTFLIAQLALQEHVALIGRIPHEDLVVWYSAAEATCLLSEREGCPNVLWESMACGTPVLATKAGGIPEIVRSQTVGLLVDRNVDAIVKGMKKVVRAQWNHDMIRKYAEGHSWEVVSKRLQKVFASLVAGEGHGDFV